MNGFRRLFLLGSALLAFGGAPSLVAQSSLSTILGNVRDPSGSAIPAAQVTITNLDTNTKSTYQTGAAGDYYVPSLLPGHYRVVAEKPGFRQAVADNLKLEVAQTLRVDIPMTIGQLAEAVQVSSTAALVDTDTTTIGQVISNQQVTELPLNGRDFTNLVKLNAGVNSVQGGNASGSSIRPHGFNDSYTMVSVNGARPASISYLVDGVTGNEPLFQTPVAIPPIDAIDEFKIENALYSAEFGMGSAQVNIALRSGGNAPHGALWEFLRNDALQPTDPHFHTKNPLKQNQFGGTFGGPVFLPKLYNGKDHSFFFVSYEGGRRRTAAFQQTQMPTAQEKQGNFSDWPTQLYNPLTGALNPGGTPPVTRAPFPNNQVPVSMLAPQSQNLLTYFPAPNVTCKLPCNNYIGNVVTPLSTDTFTVRGDHNFRANDRIFGQFLLENENAPQPSLVPLSGVNENEHTRNAALGWTHIFGPRTLNEARFGFNRLYFLQDFQTAYGPTNYWQQAGLKNLYNDGAYYALPNLTFGTQYGSIGYGGSVPFFNVSNVFQYVEKLTMTRGRHSLFLGADIRRNQNMNRSGLGGNGTLNFGGAYTAFNPTLPQTAGQPNTGNGFADYLLGYLNGGIVARFNAFDQSFSRLRNTDFNVYFQDNFRVSRQLTLNLGLRWELHTPYHDKFDGGDILDFGYPGGRLLYASQSFTQLVNNPVQAACCAPQSLIPTDWHDWAPRIGLAWRPLASTNKFVARAGYGIFYDVLDNYYPTQSVTQDVPYLSPVLPTPTGLESQPPVDIRNLFPAPYSVANRSFPPPYCQAPATSVVDPASGIITAVLNQCTNPRVQLPDNRTPYTQQWAINVQYELAPQLLVELGYQGSHGLRQPIAWSFNQAFLPSVAGNPNNSVSFISQCPAGTYPTQCSPIQARAPYYNFAAAGTALANIGQANYNAMTFKVEKRFARGLQALGAFTWGKSIDESSELGGGITGDTDRAQYGQNLAADRGLANFSQSRRLVMNWVYELPFGKGKAMLNRGGIVNGLLGGWQTNGIVTLVTGSPVNVFCGCGDRSQTGETRGTERLNVVGNPFSGFTQTRTEFFNTAAFAAPQLGTLGNAGRDILFSTGQRAIDFSMFKNYQIREHWRLQVRGEFFNLFSSHFYIPVFPTASITATNFGSLLPPGGDSGNLFNPRIIQVAMKLTF